MTYSKLPTKDSQFFHSKTPDWRPNWGSHTVKIPVGKSSMEKISIGKIPIRKAWEVPPRTDSFFFLTQWIQNIWFQFWLFQLNLIELWKKLGIHVFSRMFSEKFPNSSVTIWIFHAHCNLLESPYNRKNFPGASRPTKILTGVLIGTENWLSLGGVCCTGTEVSSTCDELPLSVGSEGLSYDNVSHRRAFSNIPLTGFLRHGQTKK